MTYADYLCLGLILILGTMATMWWIAHCWAGRYKDAADIWREKYAVSDATASTHAAECHRLLLACDRQNHEISQTLGRVLGYPWFRDDPLNFPGATEQHGVCVGEQTAETLAEEAARRITLLRIKASGAITEDQASSMRSRICGLETEISRLIHERDLCRAELKDQPVKTSQCSWCDAVFSVLLTREQKVAHLVSCDKHPLRDLQAENERLKDELAVARQDAVDAAGELLIPLSEAPIGSLLSKMLKANSIMRRERDEARRAGLRLQESH